jgi:glycosyltransferase involved in cell wall biosynthesis
MPAISIALATYNGEAYLAEQLESLARQTLLPSELVISDDGSSDRTVEIAQAFADRAPFPVRILPNEKRLGFSDNFMRAVANCRGELIAFCDQDDIWDVAKLATLAPAFDDPEVLLAFHNAVLIDAAGVARGRLYRSGRGVEVSEPLTRHPWLTVPGFLQVFRRELTDCAAFHPLSYDVNWPGQPLTHDRWFYFLASVFGRIAYVGQDLVQYRQHGANVSGVYPDRRSHLDRLAAGVRFIRAAVSAANNRSQLLSKMRQDLPERRRLSADRGAAYYEAMRRELEARKAVYVGASYAARGRALFTLLRQGSYGTSKSVARFTWWDFLLDFYLAAPLGPRLRWLLRK